MRDSVCSADAGATESDLVSIEAFNGSVAGVECRAADCRAGEDVLEVESGMAWFNRLF